MGHPNFGQIFQCDCQKSASQERQMERNRRYLLSIDGLNPRERTLTFDSLKYPTDQVYLFNAAQETMLACGKRSGFLTFVGDSDTSKSTFLMAAVNHSRDNNIPAIYITMTQLLNQLKAGFSENAKIDFEERLHILTTAEVLCIDEIDKFNPTSWAREQFDELINERWRHIDNRLTIVACNHINKLDAHIKSRINDGRAKVFYMKGPHFRNTLKE